MKKYHFYGGLFVILLLITTSCSYLTSNVTNTNNYTPPLEQAKHAQAELLAIQNAFDKKSSPLLRSLKNYKRKISGLLGLLGEGIKALLDSSDFLTGIQVCF